MRKTVRRIKYMLSYAWELDKWYLLLRFPIVALDSAKPFIMVLFPAWIIEDITVSPDISKACMHIGWMAALTLLSQIASHCFNMLLTNRYNIFEYRHAIALGRKIMSLSYPETENAETLNLVEQIRRIGYIENSFNSVFSLVSHFITIIGLTWILSSLNIVILLTILTAVMLHILLSNKSKKYNYRWNEEAAPFRRRNEYITRLMYGFQYGKEVRLNHLDEYLTGKYKAHAREYLDMLKTVTIKFFKINSIESLVGAVQLTVVYISLARRVILDSISIASFTKYISAVNTLTSGLMGLSNGFVDIKNNFKYVDDLMKFMALETEDGGGPARKLPSPDKPLQIEFKQVYFRYPNTTHNALENINVVIRPGSKIAVVGLNGSGKTTFIKLLLGLYRPTSGTIQVNGMDISQIDFYDYIDRFACAFQDFRLFSYPVQENIVLMQKYDENLWESTIRKCGIERVIESLPLKEQTPIYKFLDDNGVEFSGGEGQKIAIARALYKRSQCIILDEPLAALDPISEYEMYKSLSELIENKTSIFVSHRLSLAQSCDAILVFNDGKIVESGTHAELVRLQGGLYAEMYGKQAEFYIK